MNSKDIRALLYKKYPAPGWAFFSEVSDGTGGYHTRYADAVACGLFPSQGLEIMGFEIKSVRSDFLNELKNPQKASAVMKYCNRWWLVALKGVCVKEEIPKSWGFMEVRGERIFTVKHAPELEPVEPDPVFLASLFRRATEGTVPREALRKLQEDERKACEKSWEERMDREKQRYDKLLKEITDFEQMSGMEIKSEYGWMNGSSTGRVVKMIMSGELRNFNWRIGSYLDGVEEIKKGIEKVVELQSLLQRIEDNKEGKTNLIKNEN